jgi:two-component system, OmpR family, phosphate regulon sensor histidine kinase PhoR
MNPSFARALKAWLALAAGVLLGWIIGRLTGSPVAGAVVGATAGVGAALVVDALRAGRLLAWLRRPQDHPAPRDTGFWGEMGYRVERELHARERRIVLEAQRLEQFIAAIDASPNGVLMLDTRDQIEWCNARAADHFGLDPERDRAQRITNLVRAPAFVAYLQQGQFDAPLEFASAPGRPTLAVVVRPYGEGMKLVLSQDVTERDRADAMRRDFVANVSHEIRTPLTVLAGFVDTLQSVPLTAVEQPRVLALMRQQTDRIQSLVDDLLTLAQLEGSPRPATDRWIEVGGLVERVHADAQALSAGRHTIEVALQPGCRIAGIEGEIASAMGNLASNAVRYTPQGGRIQIAWQVRASDGCGVFEVRDSGVGIAREHLPRLTERFYRVDGSRSRETGGTGLGLAIVKHVVQRHGGELEIESEPGKGSAFRLVLPAARVRTGAPVEREVSASAAARA